MRDKSKTVLDEINETDERLMGSLKELRLKLQERKTCPTFVIFSDRTLREMSRLKPKNDSDLLRVNGVGSVKLEKYGDRFLACISSTYRIDYKTIVIKSILIIGILECDLNRLVCITV